MIFFRDGVSDGQFGIALQREFPAIRRALEAAGGAQYAKETKIAYVVAKKRHGTRFFMADPRQAPGRDNNIPSARSRARAPCPVGSASHLPAGLALRGW